MSENCDENVQHLTAMVHEIKQRMKANVGIDLDVFVKPLPENNWAPTNTTGAWKCIDGTPDGFGFKAKSVDAWYDLRDLCINKMGRVSEAEEIIDNIKMTYGNPFSDARKVSGAWREVPSPDGASLHITMYRNRIETPKADVSIHLDRIAIATRRDRFGGSRYNWRKVPEHVAVELFHIKLR